MTLFRIITVQRGTGWIWHTVLQQRSRAVSWWFFLIKYHEKTFNKYTCHQTVESGEVSH